MIAALAGGISIEGISPNFSVGYFVLFLLGFLIQGMAEEVLCRGYFMVSLARRYSLIVAIVTNAVVFAALHLLNSGITVLAFVNLVMFVIWYQTEDQLTEFRKVSDAHFTCIDRGGTFREFVPHGFSKATGIQYLLDYYHLDKSNAYAFGDSNNDLPMLNYVPNSIAMGNSDPKSLFNEVSYVTGKASEDGIKQALAYFKFE